MVFHKSLAVFILCLTIIGTRVSNCCDVDEDDIDHDDEVITLPACVCPDINFVDVSVKEAETQTILGLLDNALPGWSKTARELKPHIRSLLKSKDSAKRDFAVLTTFWLAPISSRIAQEPTICGFTQLINATIDCIRDGNNTEMLRTLATSSSFEEAPIGGYYYNLGSLMLADGVKASGCPPTIYSEDVPVSVCYKKGAVYDIDEIWNLRGRCLPEAVRKIVKKLYRSKNYLDNFIAAVATQSLLPMARRYFDRWRSLKLFAFARLQSSSPVPSCCCEVRNEAAAQLRFASLDYKPTRTIETDYYIRPSSCLKSPY